MKGVLTIIIGCLIIISCKEGGLMEPTTPPNPCEDVVCLNGGACYKGDCLCAIGYSGVRCQTKDNQSGNAGSNNDPCENVACLNGGSCLNGKCICPNGYSGSQCQNYDPCANINCTNGQCVNGVCNCNAGFTGSDCATRKPPTSMLISQIGLLKFPIVKDNGAGWDPDSGPDIYFTIDYGPSSNKLSKRTPWYRDVGLPDEGKVWIFDIGDATTLGVVGVTFIFDRLTDYWTIAIFDLDNTNNLLESEGICGIRFKPIDFVGQNTIKLDSGTCIFYLEVKWEY